MDYPTDMLKLKMQNWLTENPFFHKLILSSVEGPTVF